MVALKKVLAKNIASNAYGQAITIIVQVISVPLFLAYWGADKYGEWLILTAIPVYLAFGDLGFSAVAANEMAMLTAKNDVQGARNMYIATLTLMSLICVFLLLVTFALASTINVAALLKIEAEPSDQVTIAVLLLALGVLITLLNGVQSAICRAIHGYATPTIINNSSRVLEFVLIWVLLVEGFGYVMLAGGMLVSKTLTIFLITYKNYSAQISVKPQIELRKVPTIRPLLVPSIAFLAFPIGLALSIQGVTILVGTVLGPASVVALNTVRTITRLVTQIVTSLNQSVWPEMSTAMGKGEVSQIRKLYKFALKGSAGIVVLAGGGLLVWGDQLLLWWTNQAVPLSIGLLPTMLAAVAINASWQPSWVYLMATNKHTSLGVYFFICSLGSLPLAALLATHYGIVGVGFALIIVEVPLAIVAHVKAVKQMRLM